MSHIATKQTLLIIAAEINAIREQAEKAALINPIEAGRRLKEAKRLIPYGEWCNWLEKSVLYTQRTAQNFMKIFDAYGDKQLPALEDGTTTKGLLNVSYSQALVLLTIPEEDRAQFIKDLDMETMSVRKLKKAVKEWQQAAEQKELGNKQLNENSDVKSCQRVSNELAATQVTPFASNVALKYEILEKAYKELTYELNVLTQIDSHLHGEYVQILDDFLVRAVKERMKS